MTVWGNAMPNVLKSMDMLYKHVDTHTHTHSLLTGCKMSLAYMYIKEKAVCVDIGIKGRVFSLISCICSFFVSKLTWETLIPWAWISSQVMQHS